MQINDRHPKYQRLFAIVGICICVVGMPILTMEAMLSHVVGSALLLDDAKTNKG